MQQNFRIDGKKLLSIRGKTSPPAPLQKRGVCPTKNIYSAFSPLSFGEGLG